MSDEPPSRPVQIDVMHLAGDWSAHLPGAEDIARACAEAAWCAASDGGDGPVEVSLVLADDATVRRLNATYRGQDKATNVLSFAAGDVAAPAVPGEPAALGDVVLALETVLREARDQGKAPSDHLRHLCVHGMLHLLGHDHESDAEAAAMEALEVRILAAMGVADPYAGVAVQAGGTA